MAGAYPILNKDLLFTAAICHDIGKTKELSSFPENDYTDEGQLLGHIVIGVEMIGDAVRNIPRILFNLQKIHIGDDRRQRRLKVMRDIRYQFSLHTLAFYFLIYRLLESALDLLDFFFKWLEYTQILIDFYIQIAICNLICRFQKSVVIPFYLIKIFF